MGIGHSLTLPEISTSQPAGQWPGQARKAFFLHSPPPEKLFAVEVEEEARAARQLALAKYPRDTRACLLSHIGPSGSARRWWVDYASPKLRTAGRVVQVTMPAPNHKGGGKRGRIEVWSWQSRRNLLRQMGACEWDSLLPCLFLTLTYPGLAPLDGAIVKGHLKAFRKRFERRFHCSAVGAWKMEFQRRGVAHFHLCLQLPESLWAQGMEGGDDLTGLRQWLASAWYGIVGSGDVRHLKAGTELDWVRKDVATYFAGYSCGACKEYQNTPPEAYPNIGRWWGLWTIKPQWEEQEITHRQAVHVRRCMKRLRVSARRASSDEKVRKRKTRNVSWVLGGTVSYALATQFMRVIGQAEDYDHQRNLAIWRPHRERVLTRELLSDTVAMSSVRYGGRRPVSDPLSIEYGKVRPGARYTGTTVLRARPGGRD